MARAYSDDLRGKILRAYEGGRLGLEALAEQFGVSYGYTKKIRRAGSDTVDIGYSNYETALERELLEPPIKKHYLAYERAFRVLDNESWQVLKEKAVSQYRNDRAGQTKQGFYSQLNEAFAYRWLVHRGFGGVKILKEGKKKSPDIGFQDGLGHSYCEVKTVGISDDEIKRRGSISVSDGRAYLELNAPFLEKLQSSIERARRQIRSLGSRGIVFVVIKFDDFTLRYHRKYRTKLTKFVHEQGPEDLVIKVGHLGHRGIHVSSSCLSA